MATRITSRRNLVGVQSITYIRPINVRADVVDVRPNTKMYVFFDGVNVTEHCRQILNPDQVSFTLAGGDVGANGVLTSSATGRISFTFAVPGKTFTTGTKKLIITDTKNLADLEVTGNVYGQASATFSSKGTLELYQKTTTITTIETVVVEVPFRRDPIAQSFFTYGQRGGVFLTSIELYFQSKDDTLPVRIELREMENGYPKKNDNVHPDMVAVVSPANVNVSTNATASTKFTFRKPVYLPEDSDFCFVVRSNSKNYNLWTSKLGERSKETGNIIFEQPYVGSMFRSENNLTWTAEQFEDIKFKINKAQFVVNTASTVTFNGVAKPYAISGAKFSTTNGSPLVIMRAPQVHALTTSDKLSLAADTDGTYNGITGANLTGNFTITRVIDEYTLEFQAAANATSTGFITSSNIVRSVTIVNGGTGYTTAPSLTISAPASGTQATATCTVVDGRIVSVTMTAKGSGYTLQPSISISGVGTGAELVPIIDPMFTVTPNKLMHAVSPQITHSLANDTSLIATLSPTAKNFSNYTDVTLPLDEVTYFNDELMVASRINEFDRLSNQNSLELAVQMVTTNPNVSPTVDLTKVPSLFVYTNAINNQTTYESTSASTATATVASITVTNGGSGYSSTPTITFQPAENETSTTIVAPTITSVTRVGNVITAITLATNGSGYTRPPLVVITGGGGSGGTATAVLSSFNSEIATNGTAMSRYLTRKIQLETVSTDIKLISLIYSTAQTNVDWYVRTSLSSDTTAHESAAWKFLSCDVQRNRSGSKNDLYEYEFYSSGLAPFDTYDLKCVLRSINPAVAPIVKRYRTIVAA